MKKAFLFASILAATSPMAMAQSNKGAATPNAEITRKNAWLKIGVNAGVPIGDASKISSFTAGLDLRGQYMATRNFGIGLATGYNHYLGKKTLPDFGAIPVALMLRYYSQPKGLFVGADLGYSFFTNLTGLTGGITIKPQIGYHNYDWNIYGFYNHIITKNPYIDIQSVGITASYNIRFK